MTVWYQANSLGTILGCTQASDWRLWTYRGIQIDEDGARNVFAAARLRKEGLQRSTFRQMRRVGIGATVGLEAMLEQVPGVFASIRIRGMRAVEGVQFPGGVTELKYCQ